MSVGRRKVIQELRRMARGPFAQERLGALFARLDTERFESYADSGNGSARLVAFHDAVLDAEDTMLAVDAALDEGYVDEARKLLDMGRESLAERLAELKGLL